METGWGWGCGWGWGWNGVGPRHEKSFTSKMKEIPLVCVILKKFLKVKKKNSPITFNQRITELEIIL